MVYNIHLSSESDRQMTGLLRYTLLVAGVTERHPFEDKASGMCSDRYGLFVGLGCL